VGVAYGGAGGGLVVSPLFGLGSRKGSQMTFWKKWAKVIVCALIAAVLGMVLALVLFGVVQ